jgi:hypothetical protein
MDARLSRAALPALGDPRLKRLVERIRPTVLTLLSHGSMSLGFFLTNLLLIRSVAPVEFGTFAIVMGLLPFGTNLYGAWVIYPTTLRLTEPGTNAPEVIGAAMATGLLLSLPMAAAIAGAALVVADPWVAASAALAAPVWFAQMGLSRALIAQHRFGEAAAGDVVCYLGLPLGAFVCSRTVGPGIVEPFFALALSTGLALVFQARQCCVGLRHLRPSAALLAQFWQVGRLGVIGPLCEGGTVQLVLWTLLATHGKEAVAVYAALRSLIGVVNPFVFSTQTLVVPAVSRARYAMDARRSVREGLATAAPLLVATVGLLALVALFADWIIAVVYGVGRGYADYADVLRLFVVSYLFIMLAECVTAVYRGLGRVGAEAETQLAGAAAGVLVGLPLVAGIGLAGSALVGAITAAVRFATGLQAARRIVP